jgi:Tfp pilus assembly protein PilO
VSATNRLIVSILVIAAAAIAFWMLLLGPKREEASELGTQVESLELALSEAEAKAAQAVAAKREFPDDYRQLVVLGQAVPAGDETSSLLVELNRVARRSKVEFDSAQLSGSGEGPPTAAVAVPAPAPEGAAGSDSSAVPAASTVPPTEVAAATMPLGASIGPAGLAVMPYSLTFSGSFFEIADFIKEVDSLVHPDGSRVAVDGRLITLDAFSLSADPEEGFPELDASFSVTTYLVPPSQGIAAGATPSAPAPSTATPAASEGTEPEAAEAAQVSTER